MKPFDKRTRLPPPTCTDCEHWPHYANRRCYSDVLKRKFVKRSSEICDNFAPKALPDNTVPRILKRH